MYTAVVEQLKDGGGAGPPPKFLRVIILLYINFHLPKLLTVTLAFILISCCPPPTPNGMSGSATVFV